MNILKKKISWVKLYKVPKISKFDNGKGTLQPRWLHDLDVSQYQISDMSFNVPLTLDLKFFWY